jgi:hypothetical protein
MTSRRAKLSITPLKPSKTNMNASSNATSITLKSGMEGHERTQRAQKEGVPAIVLFTELESDLLATLASQASPFLSFALFCGYSHFPV